MTVPKPWGREIWHSAIEARGESRVLATGGEMLLSSYLQAVGIEAPIVLLKHLDPRPTPVLGDLYFEVHGEKREVYVVTAVDGAAWPDGRGRIRLGMNQALRRRWGDDAAFRAAYLRAVHRYEQVRRAIDAGASRWSPDGAAEAQVLGSAVGLDADGGGGEAAKFGGDARVELHEEERRRRAAMEEFTALAELAVGDVVVVPPWMPHALQHGVRVIEFQTPTYERHIISFAQQVVTQDGWDSEAAIARMSLEPVAQPRFKRVAQGVERIAAFPDFGVWRVSLTPGRGASLPADAPYALCMAVDNPVQVGELRLQPEEACLVPAQGLGRHGLWVEDAAVCLVAAPGI